MATRKTFTSEDREALARARALLENPSFVARAASLAGRPIEGLVQVLPEKGAILVSEAVHKALVAALDVALTTVRDGDELPPRRNLHKSLVTLSGAVGGFLGFAGLAVELPLSTTLMLRSIAEIARSEGHDLAAPETRLACLGVFALGGRAKSDDSAETGYFAVRTALTRVISDAAKHVAARGLVARGAPPVARFLAVVAARFETIVAKKAALQALPVIGGLTGASINLAFMDHFQDVASGHFTVMRLEKRYGKKRVREEYERLGNGGGEEGNGEE